MGESIRELLDRPGSRRHAPRRPRPAAPPCGRRWTARELRLFYRALSLFGTDFMLIARALPSKSRAQIVRYFHREELHSPARVDRALREHRGSAQGLLSRVLDRPTECSKARCDSFHSLESLDRDIAQSLRVAVGPAAPL